jgi:hypothetical protein
MITIASARFIERNRITGSAARPRGRCRSFHEHELAAGRVRVDRRLRIAVGRVVTVIAPAVDLDFHRRERIAADPLERALNDDVRQVEHIIVGELALAHQQDPQPPLEVEQSVEIDHAQDVAIKRALKRMEAAIKLEFRPAEVVGWQDFDRRPFRASPGALERRVTTHLRTSESSAAAPSDSARRA